jgi:site-specific recombinase XerD
VLPPSGGAGLPRSWEVEGLPAIIRRAGGEAERRTLDFFGGIRSRNTRQAYGQAVMQFMTWCEDRNLELADITAFTVNAYVIEMSREYAPRSVRQHLGAIRSLFDHLAAGKVVPLNPASQVRGPKDEAKAAKPTPLRPQEIRLLLDSIDANNTGLRDRAVIAAMAYGFARVSAVLAMDVKDYCERDGQRWLRLRERTGNVQEVPAHSKARKYLDAYLDAAGIAGQPDSPLWRTVTKKRTFSGERMSRVDVFRMVKRRLHDAGLDEAANCDSIRAAGIASYLASGGTLARATVQVEPGGGITAAEIERIGI